MLQMRYGDKYLPNIIDIIEASDGLKKLYPSNNFLCKCFIVDYLQNHQIYATQMSRKLGQSGLALTTLSKSPGYIRPDDRWGVWSSTVLWRYMKTVKSHRNSSQSDLEAGHQLCSLSQLLFHRECMGDIRMSLNES